MAGKTSKQLAVFALIEEYNQKHGTDYNPINSMIDMGLDPTVDEHVRFSAHKEIAGYIYPKRRPEDQDGNPGNDYTINVISFTQNNAVIEPSVQRDVVPVLIGKTQVGEVVPVEPISEEEEGL